MGLVDHAEIPSHVAQQIEDVVLSGHEVDRSDALGIVVPDVTPVRGSHGGAVDDREGLAELVLKLSPPLVGQVGRGDDQRPLDQPPELELLEGEPRHDRLASAGVVGDQEANLGLCQQVRVNRVHLMGQRINLRHRHGEVRVILKGQADAVRFGGEAEVRRIAGERGRFAGLRDLDRAAAEVFRPEELVPEPLGMQADRLHFHARPPSFDRQYFDRLGPVRPLEGSPVRKLSQDFVDGHVAARRASLMGDLLPENAG